MQRRGSAAGKAHQGCVVGLHDVHLRELGVVAADLHAQQPCPGWAASGPHTRHLVPRLRQGLDADQDMLPQRALVGSLQQQVQLGHQSLPMQRLSLWPLSGVTGTLAQPQGEVQGRVQVRQQRCARRRLCHATDCLVPSRR